MGKAAVAIELSGEERRELEELAGRRRTARRARIVLLAAERVLEAFKRRTPLFVEKVRDVASGSTCLKNWYSTLRTVSDHRAHRGHTNDSSVRAFAVKPRAFGAPLCGFGA